MSGKHSWSLTVSLPVEVIQNEDKEFAFRSLLSGINFEDLLNFCPVHCWCTKCTVPLEKAFGTLCDSGEDHLPGFEQWEDF